LLKAILTLDEVAVNLYHTSSSGVPLAQPVGMELLAAAAHTVPAVLLPIVKEGADKHSSFDGGVGGGVWVTQISKPALFVGAPLELENTLT
jgi:hypothetical protein